ncbi:MAG: hypothetical protein AAGI38_14675 [Bacteroidota bacterium]
MALTLQISSGKQVMLRPIGPEDVDRLRAAKDLLSPESIHTRFFQSGQLNVDALEKVAQADQHLHIAWGALDPKVPDFPGLGVARMIRQSSASTSAEVAVTVIDEWQGKGLGKLFFMLLYVLAGMEGIQELEMILLVDNQRFISKLESIGARVTMSHGEYEVILPVLPPDAYDTFPNADLVASLKHLHQELIRFKQKKAANS